MSEDLDQLRHGLERTDEGGAEQSDGGQAVRINQALMPIEAQQSGDGVARDPYGRERWSDGLINSCGGAGCSGENVGWSERDQPPRTAEPVRWTTGAALQAEKQARSESE